jgi:hypothetical protein
VAHGWLAPCAICGRQSRGHLYCHLLRRDRFPGYAFCSRTCADLGIALARENNGVIDKTQMEIQAIKEARRFLAETLTELGLLAPFYDRSAAEIDRIIEACVDGFQDAMRRQAAAARQAHDSHLNEPSPF